MSAVGEGLLQELQKRVAERGFQIFPLKRAFRGVCGGGFIAVRGVYEDDHVWYLDCSAVIARIGKRKGDGRTVVYVWQIGPGRSDAMNAARRLEEVTQGAVVCRKQSHAEMRARRMWRPLNWSDIALLTRAERASLGRLSDIGT